MTKQLKIGFIQAKGEESRKLITRRSVLKHGVDMGLTLAGISSSLFVSGCRRMRCERQPHIIMVVVDTLRSDHLGCYGYLRNTSPNIDAFAKEALLFEKCFSHSSITCASVASILSGFLPHETKVVDNIPLPTKVKTVPNILRKTGYRTMAVVSNWILRSQCGWASGFDVYDDTLDDLEIVRHMPERIAANTTARAIELLRSHSDKPMFLWIHYQDPHGPYTPQNPYDKTFSDGYDKRSIALNDSFSGYGGIPSYQKLGEHRQVGYYISQYDGEIGYMDTGFGDLITELKRLGIYEESMIIFSADHGEGMGEHDYYFAHGENLYRSIIQVPLIVRYGSGRTGRISSYVQHIDIVPTILGTIGLKQQLPYRGINLLADHIPDEREIFSELQVAEFKDRNLFSVSVDDLKLIYQLYNDKYELYNLNKDPQELNDLVSQGGYEMALRGLKGKLNRMRYEDLLGLNIVNKPHKLTDKEVRNLRSLGYLK